METTASMPSHSNTAPGFLALFYILTVIALGLIALRSYVRLHITGGWGWDDTIILVSWACLLVCLVLMQIVANLGVGRHVIYLNNPEEDVLQILRFNTFFQIINTLCALLTRVSIAIFILRLHNTVRTKRILSVLMIFMILASLQAIIIVSLTCIPLKKLWEPEIAGKCMPLSTVYICAYVQSAFAIITDLALTISPVVILWNVRLSFKRKVLICLLMNLGLLATICNALRNYYQRTLTTPDFTYDMTPVVYLAILELTSGIIAACIPACMPLFKALRKKEDSKYQVPLRSTSVPSSKSNSMQPRREVCELSHWDSALTSIDRDSDKISDKLVDDPEAWDTHKHSVVSTVVA